MAINKCDLEEILKDLPEKWRDALIKILLEIQNDRQSLTCDEVRQCQTVTQLSEFYYNDTEICITYTDENEVIIERCFSIENIINEIFNVDIDPLCVTDVTTWNTMSITEKIQALIDTVCNCCPATTTTTSSSTTTTTTEATTSTTSTSTTTTTTV